MDIREVERQILLFYRERLCRHTGDTEPRSHSTFCAVRS